MADSGPREEHIVVSSSETMSPPDGGAAESIEAASRKTLFRRFFAGQGVSLLGNEFTYLALPLLAALQLHATPFQMGVQVAADQIPSLVIAPLAGVLIDKHRPKRFLVLADAMRFTFLACIGGLALAGHLSILLLWIAVAGAATARTFFDVGYGSFLMGFIERPFVPEANSRLGIAASIAELIGQPLGGALVQWFRPAVPLLCDAMTFAVSSATLATIPEAVIERAISEQQAESLWRRIRAGFGVVMDIPVLLVILRGSALWNFFYAVVYAVYILFATRTLGLPAALIGVAAMPGAVGFGLGSWIAPRVMRRIRMGMTLIVGAAITVGWGICIWLTPLNRTLDVCLLMLATFSFGFGQSLYNTTSSTIRQLITPSDHLARVSAFAQVLFRSLYPLGAIIGGICGQYLGLRSTVLIGAVGLAISVVTMFFSPLRRWHEVV